MNAKNTSLLHIISLPSGCSQSWSAHLKERPDLGSGADVIDRIFGDPKCLGVVHGIFWLVYNGISMGISPANDIHFGYENGFCLGTTNDVFC